MKSSMSVNAPLLVGAAVAQTGQSAIPSTSNVFPLIQAFLALSAVPIAVALINKEIKPSSYLYRIFWAAAFIVNLITVSIPGRFDGNVSASSGKVEFPWNTVFAPAPWAFAIWGVIYLGETIMVSYIGALGTPVQALKNAAPYWVAGNLFQAVWTFLFRQKFKGLLWLPMTALALGSASLFGAHGELTAAIIPSLNIWDKVRLIALRSPISLHASWLTAAALLNLNAWVSLSGATLGFQVAVGFASAYFAAIAGAVIAVRRGDPLVALVIAWALAALSSQTTLKCQVAALPASTVEALALTEKVLSNILIGTAFVAPTLSKAMSLF
jgi:hypothetical protein